MLPFDFDHRATEDVRAGVRHYNRKPPQRGKEFRIALKSTIEVICRHPKIGVPHLNRIRKRTVPDFAAWEEIKANWAVRARMTKRNRVTGGSG